MSGEMTELQAMIQNTPRLTGLLRKFASRFPNDQALGQQLRKLTEPAPGLCELFDVLDLDGDGRITYRELGKAFRGKRKGSDSDLDPSAGCVCPDH